MIMCVGICFRLQEAALFEADVAVVSDDDMVEKFDAQEFAALGEAEGDAFVFGTW